MLNLKNKNDLDAFAERFEWMYKKEAVAADSIKKHS